MEYVESNRLKHQNDVILVFLLLQYTPVKWDSQKFFQFKKQLMSIGGLIKTKETEIFITIFNDITSLI